KVRLTITGLPHGGVLGSLFCALANAKIASARAAAVRTLNSSLGRSGQHLLRFTTSITPKTAAAGTAVCPVLDLILGPLHLNLLGLVIDLNRVHLTITAIPGGGVLGNLFCSLSTTTTTT